MSNRIAKIVADIQYYVKPKLSIEKIADQIDFSRPHLNRLVKDDKKDSKKVYEALVAKFGKYLQNVTNDTTGHSEPDLATKKQLPDKYLSLMEERLSDLKEDKEFLKRNLEFSLAGLHVGQRAILAHVATILDKDNERESGGNKRKEQQLKDDSSKRIGEKMEADSQMGIARN